MQTHKTATTVIYLYVFLMVWDFPSAFPLIKVAFTINLKVAALVAMQHCRIDAHVLALRKTTPVPNDPCSWVNSLHVLREDRYVA